MSVQLESGKRIAQLITAANAKTGKNGADLTAAVQSLVDSAGGGDTEAAYAQGKADERAQFFGEFQGYGARKEYQNAFYSVGWNDKNYNPVYEMVGLTNANNMYYLNLITNTKKKIAVTGGTASKKATTNYMFNGSKIEIIVELEVNEHTQFMHTFRNCDKLKELNITGTIAENGFNVQWSDLTRDSLLSILNTLKDYSEDTSGTVWTVTIGATNYAKLTQEELDKASEKGWYIE